MIAPRSVYQKEFEETPNSWIPSNDDIVEDDIRERQTNTSIELFKNPVIKYPIDNLCFHIMKFRYVIRIYLEINMNLDSFKMRHVYIYLVGENLYIKKSSNT